MIDDRQTLGKAGEDAAVQYLSQRGYRILERNYRCQFGEIDVIAQDGNTLSFIEVKTRRSQKFGPAAAAVTWTKQHHLAKACQVYLMRTGRSADPCRFDVVTVDMDGSTARIELIKDAFQLST